MERRNDVGVFELWWLMEYDSDDNPVRTEDAIGRMRTYGYDVLERVTRMVDGSGNETRYDYDAVGNRTRMIDAKDRTTRMEFDDLDRLITVMQEAESLVTQMAYDAADNQVSIEDPKGQVTAYTYDARSRLRSVTQPLGVGHARRSCGLRRAVRVRTDVADFATQKPSRSTGTQAERRSNARSGVDHQDASGFHPR